MKDSSDRELLARLGDQDVGILRLRGDVTSFVFLDAYLETPRRPVLGQIFEEAPRSTWRQATKLPVWFSNLLPEEPMRDVVAKGLGLNPDNEFRLLEALAGDLPGALVLEEVGDLAEVKARPQFDFADSEGGASAPLIKFSLAGVQLKLSMVWSSNTLTLPAEPAFGDRLVKFPSARYPGVPENEFAMMRWSKETGIDTPFVELRSASELGPIPESFDRLADSTVFVIDRFDRDGERRIHMEDLNQILGNWPSDKYEGAGHERLGLVILTLCGLDDFMEYVRRLVFCIGIGNEDAHLKNWSILYPDGVTPKLSPAYDLVSTVQYDDLDRGLALKLGDTRATGGISRATFERLARKVGVDSGAVLGVVDETLERMRSSWLELRDDLPIDDRFMARLADYQRSVPLLGPLI